MEMNTLFPVLRSFNVFFEHVMKHRVSVYKQPNGKGLTFLLKFLVTEYNFSN